MKHIRPQSLAGMGREPDEAEPNAGVMRCLGQVELAKHLATEINAMGVPRNVLEITAPSPYAEVRERLRDGDIVLCQGRDPFSKLIQWSTKSPWSHVGMVFRVDSLDQVVIIEAVEKIGVRAVALADFLSRDSAGTHPYPGKILFVRHQQLKGDVSDPRVLELAKFAFSRLGCKFAPKEIAKIALRIAGGRLLGDRKTPGFLNADDEFICSEFVAGAYAQAGLAIPWDGLGFVAPSDIAEDPSLFPVAQADVEHPPRQFGVRKHRRRSRLETWPGRAAGAVAMSRAARD
jgi:hypothetical protein